MSSVEQPIGRPRSIAPGRTGRTLLVVAIAAAVVLAGFGTYVYLSGRTGKTTLTIYAYSSLLGGPGTDAWSTVFDGFANAHGIAINVVSPPGTLLNRLVAEKNAPVADLVIGLDEITAPEAEADGLLVPYAPPGLADVPPSLVAELSPGHAVTPYEFGYLGIDYNPSFDSMTSGAVRNSSLEDFAQNQTWSSHLAVEDPTTDITGEEFLLWQIEYYTQVLHANWTGFWSAVDPYVTTAPSWSAAFSNFSNGTVPQAVVSYSTDSAYATYYGDPGSLGVTLSEHQGTQYGWKTIYGIGIVKGSSHLALDRAFIDWFLGGAVQSELPTNEWEYPANSTVALPAAYAAAIPPSSIVALNDGTTPAAIVAALPGWLNEWQAIANASG